MSARPAYFEPIRQRAADRWEQLENDSELAAPWRQLFKQVQSPRHIVSELLQNADDAGATEAIVRLEEDTFVFEHDGEDFTEEHFASLCRFGYSNKRALHTIGFRGIGFKSTFSLGKRVELFTPTLSVSFNQDRFTEPKWVNGRERSNELTTVRVTIEDQHRRAEVEKNLREWLKSPVSLLFFRNIRRIQIGEDELHWGSYGPGPVRDTEWLALHDNADETFLIARSAPEPFPEDALAEIKQERMLSIDEHADFPPCAIEIVLGVEGRLYVVLPTGVKTALPFACNAPFIQDPARLKIKDPETSPTNRWLLARAGRLSADVMLQWLRRSNSDPVERARAYGLMPDEDQDDTSLEGTCGTIVEKAFAEVIQEKEFLLTEDGQLVAQEKSIIIPRPIFDVWPSAQAAAIFDNDDRPALSHHVSDQDRRKLLNWRAIEEIDDDGVLTALRGKHLPKPESWPRLLNLWVYIAPMITGYGFHGREEALCIVPVQGKDVLCAADEAVRLGEKKLVPIEDDWRFLGDRLSVLNQNWLRYLTEKRRVAELDCNEELAEQVEAADAVLEAISLDEPSDTGKVMDQVAADFFAGGKKTLADAIRIAQIAAKLGARVGSAFRFACEDRRLRSAEQKILVDADGGLDLLLPDKWCESHLLHPDYLMAFTSCTREEWQLWVSSGRSGLNSFVPFVETRSGYISQGNIEKELKRRQFTGSFSPRYKNPWFHFCDWDFEEGIWKHWESLAEEDGTLWGKVAERILMDPQRFWSGSMTATVSEEAQNGHTRRVIRDGLVPEWILKLRERKCLRDTHGVMRKPAELLRRTPETEALRDVEPFVDAHLDNANTAPLLELLGVGDTPTGPEKLIGRIRALSKADQPAIHEVEKWYRRLDELIDGCSTKDFASIRAVFKSERLILTENGLWEISGGVFLNANEEDAPGTETVRASVRELTLWRKIGVEERPTPELAINWLQGLPSGPLPAEDLRRARALLARHAARVFEECQHWLSLSGEWTPVEEFDYALTMQPLIPYRHLHQWVKDKTANLRDLPVEISQAAPFAGLPLLAANVEERFHRKGTDIGKPEQREWLKQLGIELQRLELKDEEETERIRGLGKELAGTQWQTTRNLEIISYIDGKPAGTPRHDEAIWSDGTLYAEDKPLAKLARAISLELGRSFRNTDITDAIKLCFDRDEEFVTEYMESNFKLIPREDTQEPNLEPADENWAMEASGDSDEIAPTEEPVAPSDDDLSADEEEAAGEKDEETTAVSEDEEDDGGDDNEGVVIKPRSKDRPHKAGIMERFALSQGFQKDHENRFYDEYGNWIAKSVDGLFPWEKRSATGEVTCHYWPRDHCLQCDPLQLEAEIWSLLERKPDLYALVLVDIEGNPIEMRGDSLLALRDDGAISFHPAAYRLVYSELSA